MAYTLASVSTTNNDGTGNDFTANMPATIVAGNLLLGMTRSRTVGDVFSTPSGWTLLYTGTSGGAICVFAKIAVGADTAPTISFTDVTHVSCQISAWGGTVYADLATIVHANSTGNGTNTSIIIPALTVTVDNCLIVSYGGRNKTATSDGSSTTISGGFTEITQSNPSGASNQLTASGYINQTTATNIVQTTWTASIAENLARSGVTLALKSSSGGIPRTTIGGGFSELTGGFRG